jgi:atypical dual specificity phosphatase
LPIFDREAPTINQAYMLLIRMQKLVEQGQVLAVHCKAGLGRTGTIVAAWLIREGGLSSATAIARVRMINRGFVQSAAQEAFLEALELDLVNRIR